MPCMFIDATLSNGHLAASFPGSLPRGYADDTVLWRANWNWERRGVAASAQRSSNWTHLWPRSQFLSALALAMPMDRNDNNGGGGNSFEPESVGLSGTQSTKFLLGSCLDTRGGAVAGATVDAFLTVGDLKVGSGVSFADGTYSVGTDNPISAQHYLVAYLAGAPDILGTTVNTLTPTNIDGS